MSAIRKEIVYDDQHRPIEVRIPYEDWLTIETQLRQVSEKKVDINSFRGKLHWPEDGLEYQHRVRGEWD
jgi:hypothetical protein